MFGVGVYYVGFEMFTFSYITQSLVHNNGNATLINEGTIVRTWVKPRRAVVYKAQRRNIKHGHTTSNEIKAICRFIGHIW